MANSNHVDRKKWKTGIPLLAQLRSWTPTMRFPAEFSRITTRPKLIEGRSFLHFFHRFANTQTEDSFVGKANKE
jgi:hypothetical protein